MIYFISNAPTGVLRLSVLRGIYHLKDLILRKKIRFILIECLTVYLLEKSYLIECFYLYIFTLKDREIDLQLEKR